MAEDKKLPGIEFHLVDSSYRQGVNIVLGKVSLSCEVPDEETWNIIIDLFRKGHRMLSGELQDEYVDLLRAEVAALQAKIQDLENEARLQEARHKKDAEELERHKSLLGQVGTWFRGR